ncbi:MAG TPA: hypothetical protein VHU80_12835 [Polyangiaceae bacterium]|nr:hypothetical protein [Polyangiaceae bacterium]
MVRRTTRAVAQAAAATALGAWLLAACEAHLDVLRPAPSDHQDAGSTLTDASPRIPDSEVPPPDATARDATPSPDVTPPPDAMPPPNHAVTEIRAAYSDTCAIAAGSVYCWGLLPDGTTTSLPKRIPGAAAGVFQHVSGGATAHCATRTSGIVFCWGTNDRGELGQGDRTPRATPTRVSLPGATGLVSAKFAVFCTRLDDGRLECWGQNDEGQMGQSDVGMPQDALTPIAVESASDWVDVSSGQGHVCGVRAPGMLYCWGRNTDGELGQGSGASIQLRTPTRVEDAQDWTSVVAGQGHTCGLRGGRLYCFGNGADGQLGITPRANQSSPVQIGDGTDWRSVSTDTFHGCGIRGTGTLWCWGRNAEGQLGTGDVSDRDTPAQIGSESNWAEVSVGRFHTCARRSDGTAWCTGANDDGQLGTSDTDRRNVFTEVVWGAG